MLNIPVRGDGSIDEKERKIVEEIGAWMKVNSESIYDTRPWKIFGEGPAQDAAAQLSAQGFNEGKGKPFTHEDIRFAVKGNVLYAIAMGWPEDRKIKIKSLSEGSALRPETISKAEMLGGGELQFKRNAEALEVTLPENRPALSYAVALKIR